MSLEFSVAMCMWALPIGIGILIVSLIVVDIRCTIQDKKFHRLSTMYYERFGVKKGNEFLERCKRLRSMDEVVEVLEKALGIQKKTIFRRKKNESGISRR